MVCVYKYKHIVIFAVTNVQLFYVI